MKSLLIVLTLVTSISSMAGSIIEKESGKRIEFSVTDNKILVTFPEGFKASQKTFLPKEIEKKDFDYRFYQGREFGDGDYLGASVGMVKDFGPLAILVLPATLAADVLQAPVIVYKKTERSAKAKKDATVMQKVLNEDADITVSTDRFYRIGYSLQ